MEKTEWNWNRWWMIAKLLTKILKHDSILQKKIFLQRCNFTVLQNSVTALRQFFFTHWYILNYIFKYTNYLKMPAPVSIENRPEMNKRDL